MQQPSEQLSTFQGKIIANFVRSGEAVLTIKSNRMTLYSSWMKYRFEPQQVATIEPTDSGAILFKHTLIEYPSTIIFSPSTSTGSEVIEQIRKQGFVCSASVEDIPVRDDLPIRLQVVIPLTFLIFFLLLVNHLLGWVKTDPQQIGGSPILLLLFLCLSVRYIPIVQHFILKPGRHIGEISPRLNLLVLISGTLFLARTLALLGMPVLWVIALCYGILLSILKVSKRLNSQDIR